MTYTCATHHVDADYTKLLWVCGACNTLQLGGYGLTLAGITLCKDCQEDLNSNIGCSQFNERPYASKKDANAISACDVDRLCTYD